jgi:hypothetical protein
MRTRTKRDIGILLGVVAVIGAIAFANSQMQRGGLARQMEQLRSSLEEQRAEEGLDILSWSLMRQTTGSMRRGGEFAPELVALDGHLVNVMGFMVPQEQFRNVDNFMMLPLPIECYFCAMPPDRDIMHVQLKDGEREDIWKEPVLIIGTLNIHQGPDVRFFYSLTDAVLVPAEKDARLTRREMELQHMVPQHEPDPALLLDPVYEEDDATLRRSSD